MIVGQEVSSHGIDNTGPRGFEILQERVITTLYLYEDSNFEMKSAYIVLIACVVWTEASDVDPCTAGPSFWCSSIKNAKACNALQHCKTQTWSNNALQQDNAEVCEFCKTVIGEVQTMIADTSTQDEIRGFLDSACKIIPAADIADKCKNVIDEFLPEVMDMIAAELDPQTVCSLLYLCSAQAAEDGVLVQLPSVGIEPLCTDCKKLVDDIKQLVLSPGYEKQLEEMIDDNVCKLLGSLEDECREVVHSYLPELQQLIASFIDSDLVCQAFGLCSGDMHAARAQLALQVQKHHLMAPLASGEACSFCEMVVGELKSLAQDKSVQTSVEDFIRTEICARLGPMNQTCNQYVDAYLPLIFSLLADELDPQATCQMLGLCSAELSLSNAIRKNSLVLPQSPAGKPVEAIQTVKASTLCVLCEFVVRELDSMLADNATEAEIIAALDKVCSYLPSSIAQECNDFVDEYGPAIIDLLEQELDPSQICTALGLCNSLQSNPGDVTVIKEAELCGVCETVFQYVDTLLETNSTVAEIEAVLDKVCSFLPDTIKGQCQILIDTYGPQIAALLEKELDPQTVCTELGLCGQGRNTPPVKQSSGEVCGLCETVMQEVNSALEDNRTVEAIETEMKKACSYLPTQDKLVCDLLVSEYGAQIVQLVAQYADPKEICQSIGLCSMQEVTNEIVPVKVHLLGDNECTYGPAYWCASKENAAKCKAEAHCMKHVWGN